jgi:type II restriction/modification system DNA methylase subunit YeeA
LIEQKTITSLIQLEYSGFDGATVPICTFTAKNVHLPNYKGGYVRLSDFRGAINQAPKALEAIKNPDCGWFYTASAADFKKIPGTPVAYWISEKIINVFHENKKLYSIAEGKKGLSTGKNELFIRNWQEIEFKKFGVDNNTKKWIPLNKGGKFRKWYGNNEVVINWENNGEIVKKYEGSVIRNEKYYFKEAITWTMLSSSKFGVRISKSGFIFEGAGPCIFVNRNIITYVLSLLVSKISFNFIHIINPTVNHNINDILNLPFIVSPPKTKIFIDKLANECIYISKEEWNSREISWDFKINELLNHKTSSKLEDAYDNYCNYWRDKFFQLHKNEEELNRLFIDIYDLADELTPDVPLEDITILRDETHVENSKLVFNKDVLIKQFISYAVGCMFGRYSPHKEGLILANQGEGMQEFMEKVPDAEFLPDEDDIIPILDEEYFTDDIVGRFKEFLKVTFGPEKLSENMDFIAGALSSGGKKKAKSSEQVIRDYFLKDFYKDHVKMYKKRPIYWLFTSGKKRAFNALVYIHRYDRTTLARMRTEYLLELEGKMDAHREMLSSDDARSAKEKVKLAGYIEEIMAYDEVLKNKADAYIEIDLDDGVKENYKLFEGLVGKI